MLLIYLDISKIFGSFFNSSVGNHVYTPEDRQEAIVFTRDTYHDSFGGWLIVVLGVEVVFVVLEGGLIL